MAALHSRLRQNFRYPTSPAMLAVLIALILASLFAGVAQATVTEQDTPVNPASPTTLSDESVVARVYLPLVARDGWMAPATDQ